MFGIDRQVYYRKKKRKARRGETAEKAVALVREVRTRMPRLGTRKLHHLLAGELAAIGVGRDRLFAIIGANGLTIRPRRNYRVTTDTYHRFHRHGDLVSGTAITRPEQVWVADITYIGARGSNSYLALVTDAYSKKIVGYDLSGSLNADGAARALGMAVKNRCYRGEALVHHSDKGVQYCCDQYQRLLTKHKLKCSMTQGYDPYSNAVAERVNGILKDEFMLEDYRVPAEVLEKIVAESIGIYNSERPHLSCSYLTPDQMHRQREIAIKTYKNKSGNRLQPVPAKNIIFTQ